jgi:hypothetical protein
MKNFKQILNAIEVATGIHPTAFNSWQIQNLPNIAYTLYRQSDNAVIESWRLSIRITTENLQEALEIDETIANLLCTLGDEEKFGKLRIAVNGGGTLEDPNTGLPQIMSYYDIQDYS